MPEHIDRNPYVRSPPASCVWYFVICNFGSRTGGSKEKGLNESGIDAAWFICGASSGHVIIGSL